MLVATCNKVVTCELTNTREKRAGHGTSDFVSAHYRPALWPRSTFALHVVPPVSEIYTTHHPAGQGRGWRWGGWEHHVLQHVTDTGKGQNPKQVHNSPIHHVKK